jgi:predicted permease
MKATLRTARRYWKLIAISCFSLSIAMALGILALSVSNTVLLMPPSGAEPDRLVMIYSRAPRNNEIEQISYPDYQYLIANNHVFTGIAAAPNSIGLNVDSDSGYQIKLATRPVSDNYFSVLGIRPYLGRFFSQGESSDDEAVMSHACWKRLGSDRKIVGRRMAGLTIVGVAPREFTGGFYGANGDIFDTYRHNEDPKWLTERQTRRLFLTARLKPGISRTQAQAELAGLAAQLSDAYPKEDKGRSITATRATLLPPDAIPDLLWASAIMMLLVLLVLLIACANVANLMLAAATGRRQEAAIKLAIGAPRGRLIREFLWESTLLCLVSGAIGYGIAAFVSARLSTFSYVFPIWGSFSFSIDLKLGGAVIAFTLGLIVLASLATGLAPALYASSPALSQIIGGEAVAGGSRGRFRRNALVVVQVAVCTLVLVGMGLCERDIYNLRHADLGFSQHNLLGYSVFSSAEDSDQARAPEFYEKLRRATAALPGVEAVSLAWDLPLLGSSPLNVQIPGVKPTTVSSATVDDRYFSTIGVNIVAGRAFNQNDREKTAGVAIINQKMADMYWKGRNPLGQTVMVGEPPHPATIVGVAATGKYDDIDEAPISFVYLNLNQNYRNGIQIIARTSGEPERWVEPLRKAMRGLGLKLVVEPVTLAQWIDLDLLGVRVASWVVGVLSALGLVLALIGLLGAVSYSVGQRKKELGIRVALGARRGQLLTMILRQIATVAGIGIVAGLALGVVASALLQEQFYRMGALEWTVLAPVAALMMSLSLAMAYLSARPWTKVDPMEAVRHV